MVGPRRGVGAGERRATATRLVMVSRPDPVRREPRRRPNGRLWQRTPAAATGRRWRRPARAGSPNNCYFKISRAGRQLFSRISLISGNDGKQFNAKAQGRGDAKEKPTTGGEGPELEASVFEPTHVKTLRLRAFALNTKSGLGLPRKSDARKVLQTKRLRRETTMSWKWIALERHMAVGPAPPTCSRKGIKMSKVKPLACHPRD